MFDLFNFGRRREIDRWRDEQIIAATKMLNQLAADLIDDFSPRLSSATWTDLIAPANFISEQVSVAVRERADQKIRDLIDHAHACLAEIVDYQAIWSQRPELSAQDNNGFEAIRDVAVATGPFASGVAVALALPAAASVTTAGLFGTGLFAVTVVSWPVVAVGATVAAIGVSTGVIQGSRIKAKATGRLRRDVVAYITKTLISGPKDSPSMLEQLATLFTEDAREARKRL